MDRVLNPKTILTDLKQAAMNAYKFNWPSVELKGCFFHFNQAILRWAFRNGYKLPYSTNYDFYAWCKMILSLAVVPVNRVMEAWNIIINKLPADLNVQPIINYFYSIWING